MPDENTAPPVIETVIAPRRRRVGDGEVDRLLPFRTRRMIGPFVFADLIGPDRLAPGVGVDVPVHPHIGLATVTYLFEGALVHRDSTAVEQRIDPGGVNWMTAGRGVAHSERSPDDARAGESTMAGLQTWVALPDDAEDVAPSFEHVAASDVPVLDEGDARVRLLAGRHRGREAPVRVLSELFHLDVTFASGGAWSLADDHVERAVLVVEGEVTVGGTAIPARHLAVLAPGAVVDVTAAGAARVMAFGGSSVGRRFIEWNYVASDRDRIRRADAAWRSGEWPAVPGDDERVEAPPARS